MQEAQQRYAWSPVPGVGQRKRLVYEDLKKQKKQDTDTFWGNEIQTRIYHFGEAIKVEDETFANFMTPLQ